MCVFTLNHPNIKTAQKEKCLVYTRYPFCSQWYLSAWEGTQNKVLLTSVQVLCVGGCTVVSTICNWVDILIIFGNTHGQNTSSHADILSEGGVCPSFLWFGDGKIEQLPPSLRLTWHDVF